MEGIEKDVKTITTIVYTVSKERFEIVEQKKTTRHQQRVGQNST